MSTTLAHGAAGPAWSERASPFIVSLPNSPLLPTNSRLQPSTPLQRLLRRPQPPTGPPPAAPALPRARCTFRPGRPRPGCCGRGRWAHLEARRPRGGRAQPCRLRPPPPLLGASLRERHPVRQPTHHHTWASCRRCPLLRCRPRPAGPAQALVPVPARLPRRLSSGGRASSCWACRRYSLVGS
jgi:hypothetical protein